MQIRLLLSICSLLLISLHSRATIILDSIGTENLNGKKLIVHKVELKESYYAISRKYKVNPQSVIEFNNNVSLHIGIEIKVPTDRIFNNQSLADVNTNNVSKVAVVDYKVGPGETLYAISNKFNTSIEEIKSLNRMSNNLLAVGQILKIRYGNASNLITPATTIVLNVPQNRSQNGQSEPVEEDSSINAGDRLKLPPARYGLREVDERGVAIWISDNVIDGTKMLALHRTAPVGTVIKVTNPMTTKSTFAKVVGKFTENESTRDVIVVITKATADMVGAIDKRFQVSIVYGVPNE